ncbi:unnamed protein product [Spirodela intermedia]|uniref:N-acetyltransferase domain-containing protein n=1 Tax=Spirodela intermedia TaxID=51605 RepID=A0A7I8KMG8_SPIIN|nr:unnamed protein product [Spirodela intermedia]
MNSIGYLNDRTIFIEDYVGRESRVIKWTLIPASAGKDGNPTQFIVFDGYYHIQYWKHRLKAIIDVSDKEMCKGLKRAFGRFVAREAVIDEEYWTASWLRAEAHWDPMSYMRHVDNYKRKYAEEEFNALKRRCAGREGNSLKCLCIVSVKKEDPNIRRTVLNSVVGTLDLSIRLLLHGEKFPGEIKKPCSILATHDTQRYAYIANVCVSKFARRQGIASNMLYLATDMAVSAGMKQLFVHVHADNTSAQELYRKIGFEVVGASPPASEDPRFLMCMEL